MKLLDIIKNIEIQNISNANNPEINTLCYDNRKATAKSLFFALIGASTDGHKFIKSAIDSGAEAIICQDDTLAAEYPAVTFVKVSDSRYAMAIAAHNYNGSPANGIENIAITGTNGKTTTTFLLRNMLNQLNEKVGIIGTTGIFIADELIPATHTTPESLELAEIYRKMAYADVNKIAIEVSSHALCQHRAAGINFAGALFTNLTHEHLDYHKTMEEYAKAKKILFDNLQPNAIAIVFDTSEYSNYILQDCKADRQYKIGYNPASDIQISDIQLNLQSSEFTLSFHNSISQFGTIRCSTKLIGKFNVENAALAVAYLILSGVNPQKVVEILANADGAPGRMDRIALKNGAIAVVDYAHTPDALEKALTACRELLADKPDNKLISVFGCGGDRDATKRPIMGNISTTIADYTIITDDNPRTEDPQSIILQIIAGVSHGNKEYVAISPRETAIRKAVAYSNSNDIILIAGKGHENYQIIGTEKHHFDDKEIVAESNKN